MRLHSLKKQHRDVFGANDFTVPYLGNRKLGHDGGNRCARYDQLTVLGQKQLEVEKSQFERVVSAMTRVIEAV